MDTSGAAQRYCRKCLLRETSEQEFFEKLYDYVAHLPAEDKVPADVYEARLAICKECDHLLSGMCRRCGCYVEMRAAMKVRACPDIPARWQRYEDKDVDDGMDV